MIKQITLVIIIGVLIILGSCSNNINGPIQPVPVQPGRRDYTWSVDTLSIFSNYISSIWGNNADDIWGVGPGGALSTTIWHYDGKQWKTDGISRSISPESVYGFAKNDVWIAGANGRIWHYDGNDWTQNHQHTINGFTQIWLVDLYGTSNHDLYAVGTVWFDNETRRGIILHYDGNNWKQEYLADFNSYFYKVRESYDKRVFIHSIKQDVKYNSSDTTVFYEFDGNGLKQIYTDENKSIRGGWMTIINGDIVFSLDDGIYKYIKNTLQPITKYDSRRTPGAIFGRNEKDIFLGTSEGIAQYNGTDIQLLVRTEGWINDGQVFDKEVFFLDTTLRNGISLIYHGKINTGGKDYKKAK